MSRSDAMRNDVAIARETEDEGVVIAAYAFSVFVRDHMSARCICVCAISRQKCVLECLCVCFIVFE